MEYDLPMILSLVRGAMGNIAKAERLLKRKAPNRMDTELSINQGSEELFKEACEVFTANERFFNFCKNKADVDFLTDLKL